jgi:hypothetical protein
MNDDFKYVFKIQGSWSWGESLNRRIDRGRLRVLKLHSELVYVKSRWSFGRTEDEEIQDLLQGSQGLNLALHFLSGDPVVTVVDAKLASKIG